MGTSHSGCLNCCAQEPIDRTLLATHPEQGVATRCVGLDDAQTTRRLGRLASWDAEPTDQPSCRSWHAIALAKPGLAKLSSQHCAR
eukprot:1525758-Amphidinium_carterae.1